MSSAKMLITAVGCIALAGCMGPPVRLPANVTTTLITGTSSQSIDHVDFSYTSTNLPVFSKLKVCVASNVDNDAVTLHDAAGSVLGPAHYYSNDHTTTVAANQTIKFSDDEQKVILANGTADGGPVAAGLTRDIVKYELQAGLETTRVKLVFVNITRAQKDTGSGTNDGFNPVGTWSGARPLQTYDALQAVANKIRSCLQ